MHPTVITSGTYTITNPSQIPALTAGSNDLELGGTSPTTEPVIKFRDGTSNTIGEIDVGGGSVFNPNVYYYGEVDVGTGLYPYSTLTLQNGVHISNGSLRIGTADGETVTLNGNSIITNNSTFTAYGGRYQADRFVLNGSMIVANKSVADFSHATLKGNGTVSVGYSAEVDMKNLLAGINVVVAGGRLHLLRPGAGEIHETGTIYETGGTSLVELDVPQVPTKEIFHTATGTMDLLNKAGAEVASLKFAPGSREYAQVEGGAGHGPTVFITTTPEAHALPTIFVH
jgi:hypothetical protein